MYTLNTVFSECSLTPEGTKTGKRVWRSRILDKYKETQGLTFHEGLRMSQINEQLVYKDERGSDDGVSQFKEKLDGSMMNSGALKKSFLLLLLLFLFILV
jgi:hypothetical protein